MYGCNERPLQISAVEIFAVGLADSKLKVAWEGIGSLDQNNLGGKSKWWISSGKKSWKTAF
jgi:hypothetical protein